MNNLRIETPRKIRIHCTCGCAYEGDKWVEFCLKHSVGVLLGVQEQDRHISVECKIRRYAP